MTEPQTKYVRAGAVHVAYQVIGGGPIDLVWIPGSASQMGVLWEEPTVARFYRRLASFSRLIMFDKRGTGMSDRTVDVATLEDRMDDVRAVLDAVGSERVALVGQSEGGAIGALFAATYPERATSLVAIGTGATSWLPNEDMLAATLAYIDERWGTGGSAATFAPSVADDPQKVAWFARWEQLSGSPGAIKAVIRMNQAFDVRPALPAVSAPTLVIHRTGDQAYTVEQGRELADGSPVRASSSCRGATMRRGSRTPTRSSTSSRSTSPASDGGSTPTGCWPRRCSPTSSTRPHWPAAWATADGATCSTPTTPSSVSNLRG